MFLPEHIQHLKKNVENVENVAKNDVEEEPSKRSLLRKNEAEEYFISGLISDKTAGRKATMSTLTDVQYANEEHTFQFGTTTNTIEPTTTAQSLILEEVVKEQQQEKEEKEQKKLSVEMLADELHVNESSGLTKSEDFKFKINKALDLYQGKLEHNNNNKEHTLVKIVDEANQPKASVHDNDDDDNNTTEKENVASTLDVEMDNSSKIAVGTKSKLLLGEGDAFNYNASINNQENKKSNSESLNFKNNNNHLSADNSNLSFNTTTTEIFVIEQEKDNNKSAVSMSDNNFAEISTEAAGDGQNVSNQTPMQFTHDDDDDVIMKGATYSKNVESSTPRQPFNNSNDNNQQCNTYQNDNDNQRTTVINANDATQTVHDQDIDDDDLVTTTPLEVDKFKLNDQVNQATALTRAQIIEFVNVEEKLMEINEPMPMKAEKNRLSVAVAPLDGEKEPIVPQHLLLDELMLNDDDDLQLPHRHIKAETSNDVLHYADDDDANDIDIVRLEDTTKRTHNPHDNVVYKTIGNFDAVENESLQNKSMQLETLQTKEKDAKEEDARIMALPKPIVSESYDKPSKRIFINVSIATDDSDGSIYTLHVAVPTNHNGGEHNVEQLLTHERQHKSDTLTASPYCIPEPPPPIPDCPCACAALHYDTNDFNSESRSAVNTYTDKHNNNNVVDVYTTDPTIDSLPTTSTTSTTTTSTTTTKSDTLSASTTTSIDLNTTRANLTNHARVLSDNNTDSGVGSFACPDVMPILILEGVFCFCFCFLCLAK